VVLTAARYGRGPASLAAALAVLLFNVMFVPPRFSFAVADEQFFFTFAVMLGVGLVVGQLTAGLRAQAEAARASERQVRSLYDISRELGGALTAQQVADALVRFAREQLAADATLWVRDGALGARAIVASAAGAPTAQATIQVPAQVAALLADPAAPHAPTYAEDGRSCVLPLVATMATRGAMALQRAGTPGPWTEDQRQLMRTCAHLLAGALERIHYLEVAQSSAVEIEGERMRNVLLAAVSHDLRTPLASLIGLAESMALTRPAPSAQQREIALAVAASARRMGVLVDNLLEMARLQSGRVQLNLQWQPIEEVVGTAVAAVPGLDTRPVQLRIPEDLPLVLFDAVLIERVLVNLLENAVKYTPEGSDIEVRARLASPFLCLSVCDHGPGVPPERAEGIFRTFERGQREGATPGVGLGLALCRIIVEAHAGTLKCLERPGGGACFEVRLPLGEPPLVPQDDERLEGQG
jgi:two-component system sensor histidine kinase KdpD